MKNTVTKMTPLEAITTMKEFEALSTDASPGPATVTVQIEPPRGVYKYEQKMRAILRLRLPGHAVIRLELDRTDAAILGAAIVEASRIGDM